MVPFANPQVQAVFESREPKTRDRLIRLREMIFQTAAETEGVGALQECLKWGQPSYITAATRSGSTIRIDQHKSGKGFCAVYVHCQTTLVETYRSLFPDTLRFEGNRAIILDPEKPLPLNELKVCIALALTYHLDKKKR